MAKSKVVKVNVLDVHRPVNGDLESFWQTLKVAGLFNYVPCRPILKEKLFYWRKTYPVPSTNLLPLSCVLTGQDMVLLSGMWYAGTVRRRLKNRAPPHTQVLYSFITVCVFTCHEYATDSWPPPSPNNTPLMKSIHVGQLGSLFVCNRMFMKMILDRSSSSYANLWDLNDKPLISAAGDKEGFFFWVPICRACLDFIPRCKWCFRCNHAKAQLASISLSPLVPLLLAHTPSTPPPPRKPSRAELFLLSLSVCHCCLLQPRVCSLLLLLISFPFSSLTCHAS